MSDKEIARMGFGNDPDLPPIIVPYVIGVGWRIPGPSPGPWKGPILTPFRDGSSVI